VRELWRMHADDRETLLVVALHEPIGPSLVCGALFIAAGIGVTGGSR
jgi:hypothetical protein